MYLSDETLVRLGLITVALLFLLLLVQVLLFIVIRLERRWDRRARQAQYDHGAPNAKGPPD